MPSVAEHLGQAQRNEFVAKHLADNGFHDWAVSALFYAGLNLMQGYFVQRHVEVTNHFQRRAEILRDPQLRILSPQYHVLKSASENARYLCRSFTASEYELIADAYAGLAERLRELLG